MSNIKSLCENQNRYTRHIQSFRFVTKDDVNLKSKKVFMKMLIICLYLSICGISSNYVFAVFFGDEVRAFPIYFLDFMNSLVFYFILAFIGFFTTTMGIIIHKLNVYAYSSPIKCSKRLNKLFMVVKQIPELESLVATRLHKQGYFSEMDYQSLEIDAIYKELFD